MILGRWRGPTEHTESSESVISKAMSLVHEPPNGEITRCTPGRRMLTVLNRTSFAQVRLRRDCDAIDEKWRTCHIRRMTTHPAIRARRKALGLSQTALAQKTGLTRATVSRFEQQGVDIGLEAFTRLLDALGLVMKIEAANEVVVKNWDQFEAQRRSQLLAEARAAAAQNSLADQVRALRSTRSKVLNWGKL